MPKKESLIELFYITLFLTASRPSNRSLLLPQVHLSHHFAYSDVLVENYFYDDIHSTRLNGFSPDQFHVAKSSILLQETLEVLEDINSLGRYSQHQHSSNLIAFPVNGLNNFVPNENENGDPDILSNQENNEEHLNHFDLNNYSSEVWESLEDDPLIQASNSSCESLPENDLAEGTRSPIDESNELLDAYLLSDSFMLSLDSGNGDVNDLFGELEFLLSNETDSYVGNGGGGQEWQTLYSSVATNENDPEYPIYDATQNCNIYENGSNGQILNNTSGPYSQNFGTVIYSSLATLSNGQEQDLASNLVYNGNAVHDTAYLTNVPFNNNNPSTDCYYNGYTEEFNISNFNDINQTQNFEYQQLISTPMNNKFQNTNTEDCFDKSSDSAVSSMSSDRVQSLSDNDLIETSSEASSYNCDVNLPGANMEKCNAAAQKKYRLFGKNKNPENCKNFVDYYPDYSQVNYIYSNSVPCSVDSNENYNQINYYSATTAVTHNHSYVQIPEHNNEALNSISSNLSSQDWINHQETHENEDTKDDIMLQRQKSIIEKSREENGRPDHSFNRDEKRARALNLPISTQDIINLPIDEFNERLTKYELTEIQLSLIRDIRRRGKNKVAAQNCRKRKLDQIMGLQSEVDNMYSQKANLENQYNQLIMLREMARDKYTKLYQFVVEASSSRQPFFELSSSPPDFPVKDSSNEIQINDNTPNGFMVSGNITSPVPISSYGLPNEFSNQQK